MFSSVRWPLTLALFLLTLCFVAATEWALFATVRSTYLENTEEALRQDCSFIANLMGRHMDQAALTASERKMITDEMSRLSLQLSGRLCIINWRGDVLEDSAYPSRPRGTENFWERREVFEALHGKPAMKVRGLDPGDVGEPAMYVAVPMLAKGNVAGAIYGSRSLGPLQLTLVNLRERLYLVALASLSLALLVSLLLARLLTAPLRRLTVAVKRFGEGHREERVVVKSRDELAILGQAFNTMADRLKEQHELLLQFVSDASHELKTPLASLRSLIEALEGGAWERPDMREKFLAYVHRDLDRMEKLVADLLELHRLDRAALRLEMSDVELRPLLAELAAEYEAALDCPMGVRVRTDRDRLRQVLTNLLENGRRAARAAEAPQLKIVWNGQLVVEDNGVGLAPEHLERIFDRFYRVDGARSRDDGGTGLGLAITRGLVEAMGATIRAESAGPGQGARFLITF